MHTDPIQDADNQGDKASKALDKRVAAEKHIEREITELFTMTIRLAASHKYLSVPYASYSDWRIKTYTIAEVVVDQVHSGKPNEALMQVLAQSECPHVQALREAIAADYCRMNVESIAEISE